MAAGLLLLVCAGAVLYSVGAQDPYSQLDGSYQRGVDLALDKLRTLASVHHHFRFFRGVEKSKIESGFGVSFLYHHFHLKPTRCPKGTNESDAQRCAFRNDRPLMDCTVCYKTVREQIEWSPEPYIHCIRKPNLTEEMKRTRTERCEKLMYNSGSPTLLAVSTG